MSLTNSIYGEKKETLQLRADATSLADLKAEMVRKKAEALQNKQKGNYRSSFKIDDFQCYDTRNFHPYIMIVQLCFMEKSFVF